MENVPRLFCILLIIQRQLCWKLIKDKREGDVGDLSWNCCLFVFNSALGVFALTGVLTFAQLSLANLFVVTVFLSLELIFMK